MTESFYIGDRKEFKATFKDANGTLTDPTTVTGTIRDPDAALTTPTVNNLSTGVYTMNFEFAKPGRHIAYFIGDGALNAAVEIEAWARYKGTI